MNLSFIATQTEVISYKILNIFPVQFISIRKRKVYIEKHYIIMQVFYRLEKIKVPEDFFFTTALK